MTTDKSMAGGSSAEAFDPTRLSLLWAVQAHAPAIAELHASMFETPWTADAVSRLLSHPGSIALVAWSSGQREVGGFALAQIAADEAEILSLAVKPSWRRRGVGRQLVEGIKRASQRGGAATVFLEVAADNEAGKVLYARAGFAEAASRKGYYQRAGAPPVDALVLKAALSN